MVDCIACGVRTKSIYCLFLGWWRWFTVRLEVMFLEDIEMKVNGLDIKKGKGRYWFFDMIEYTVCASLMDRNHTWLKYQVLLRRSLCKD